MAFLTIPRRVAFGANGLSGVNPNGVPPGSPRLNVPPPSPITEPLPAGSLPSEMTTMGRLPENLDFRAYPEGASPSQKTGVELQAMYGAAPRSPVLQVPGGVNVEPPRPQGRGFWNTLKNIGRGAVIGMGDVASRRGGADLGELLGGAAAGGIGGGISPMTIDRRIADEAIRRKEYDLQRQMEIEAGQAQLQKMLHPETQKPDFDLREDEEGNFIRQQWNPKTGRMEDVIGPDGKPVIVKRTPPKAAAGGRHVIGNVMVDDQGKVIYKGEQKPDRVDVRQREERQRNYNAAEAELKSLAIEEAQIRTRKVQADKLLQQLKSISPTLPDGKPNPNAPLQADVNAAQAAVDDVQRSWEALANKKRDAQFKLDSNRDTGETQPTPSVLNATEQKIYDAAKKGGKLDPDEAVRRYRAGQY